jgi:hypothetical protein
MRTRTITAFRPGSLSAALLEVFETADDGSDADGEPRSAQRRRLLQTTQAVTGIECDDNNDRESLSRCQDTPKWF